MDLGQHVQDLTGRTETALDAEEPEDGPVVQAYMGVLGMEPPPSGPGEE
ncbi:hypothetical protein [Nocardia wallacei]|uniref:Uncharacterized protein n=1 Tax=Nocardia wallacei TaxID=480035 RepID=A0A7G1KT47_9NOCA|nr:hypothetical protein [Nocardia wallacei]BCK58415.1 hypothetical protein NWFMUON74_61870 [Nocardia wallacei]